jgi:flagellar basal body-associated protein FliL
MESNKYLPTGTIIGGHYETIDVLGEDAFEILYLVRDNHRRGSFFVLKELFLETFSSRNQESVYTTPQAQGVFNKRKQEIINEIDTPKKVRQVADVKTYGYIEDNNTIYTIMEFTNNSDLTHYLQFHPKDEIVLPSVEELNSNSKTKKKSSIFLKILIVTVLIGVALALYANKMIQEDRAKAETKQEVIVKQTPLHYPELTHRSEKIPKIVEGEDSKVETANRESTSSLPKNREYIPTTERATDEVKGDSTDTIKEDAIYIDNETEEIIDEEEIVDSKPTLPVIRREATALPPQEKTSSFLGTKIESKKENIFNKASIQNFLNNFIASSATGSVEDIASQYDYHVDRYFSLTNVTHSTIKRDKRRYNRRWTHREFLIENFKILKIYHKDNRDYCDVKTTTKWRVSTNSGKQASGTSRGFMTIKETSGGFKVKSIYTIR